MTFKVVVITAAVTVVAAVQLHQSVTFRSGYILAEVAVVAIVKQQHSDILSSCNYGSSGSIGSSGNC